MTYKSLMVCLTLGAPNHDLLSVAGEVAERFHAGVTGVSVCQTLTPLFPTVYAAQDSSGKAEDPIEIDRVFVEKQLRAEEENFRDTLEGRVPELHWRSATTTNGLPKFIADQARCADLVLLSPMNGSSEIERRRRLDISDIVMNVGRPVLLVPQGFCGLDLDRVLICWNNSREARRAVWDSLPLLQNAKNITVVEVIDAESMSKATRDVMDVVEWLRGHGIRAESLVERAAGWEAVQLASIAANMQAGLLVAGAYGHSRLREWVLGSVTLDLLSHPKRPALLSH